MPLTRTPTVALTFEPRYADPNSKRNRKPTRQEQEELQRSRSRWSARLTMLEKERQMITEKIKEVEADIQKLEESISLEILRRDGLRNQPKRDRHSHTHSRSVPETALDTSLGLDVTEWNRAEEKIKRSNVELEGLHSIHFHHSSELSSLEQMSQAIEKERLSVSEVLAPFRQAPCEIIRKILSLVVETEEMSRQRILRVGEWSRLETRSMPILFKGVCRAWSQFVKEMPELWSNMWIDLNRSQAASQHITKLHLYHLRNSPSTQLTISVNARNNHKFHLLHTYMPDFVNVPNSIKRFVLAMGHDRVLNLDITPVLENLPCPQELVIYELMRNANHARIPQKYCQSLTHFHSSNSYFTWNFMSSSVESCSLKNNAHGPLSEGGVAQVLRMMPNIQRLRVDWTDEIRQPVSLLQPRRYEHGSIHTLEFRMKNLETSLAILQEHVSLPQLKRIVLINASCESTTAWLRFLENGEHARKITQLKIRKIIKPACTEPTHDPLICLKPLVNLDLLELCDTSTACILKGLAQNAEDANLDETLPLACSKLTKIRITNTAVEPGVLQAFIRERTDYTNLNPSTKRLEELTIINYPICYKPENNEQHEQQFVRAFVRRFASLNPSANAIHEVNKINVPARQGSSKDIELTDWQRVQEILRGFESSKAAFHQGHNR